MAGISLDKVSKTYPGGVAALADVSLQAAEGSYLAVLGPSGCGKTTLLRVIAGLETADGGTVAIAGRDVTRADPSDRGVAMVFQSATLYPHLSVRRNLGFGASGAGLGERCERAARLLRIEELLDRAPGELSGGQRQRAALGRVMVRRPSVLLLDEPLSSLDGVLRAEMRGLLRAVHAELGGTAVHVTHDREEALTLAGAVAVMCGGRVRQIGSPAEVYRSPADRFVAAFVGSMSFVAGRVVRDGGIGLVEEGGGRIDLGPAADRFAPHEGKQVVLGVRAEGVGPGREGWSAVPASVEWVEPVSGRVHARTSGGAELVGASWACSGVSGVSGVWVNAAEAVAFEPGEFGANLTRGA